VIGKVWRDNPIFTHAHVNITVKTKCKNKEISEIKPESVRKLNMHNSDFASNIFKEFWDKYEWKSEIYLKGIKFTPAWGSSINVLNARVFSGQPL
jgi:hypothetical protein